MLELSDLRIRRAIRLLVLSLVLFVGLNGSVAIAQGASDIPPVFQSVDENGVDVVAGTIGRRWTGISIGPDGPGGLSYNFGANAEAATITRGYVTNNGVNNIFSVNIGSTTETFTQGSPGSFTQSQGRPSTLTYDSSTQRYTYTDAGGMVAVFQTIVPQGGDPAITARITTITFPAGEVQNFVYGASGLQSIWTNLGYQMRFISGGGGALSQVVLFNMATVPCDPTAPSCSIPGTWPRLTFNIGSGTTTATDSLNQVTQVQGSANQITVTYPGNRQMVYNFTNGKVTSVFDGAGTWTYTYANNGVTSTTTIGYPGGTNQRLLTWYTATGAVITDQLGTPGSYRTTVYVRDSKNRIERIVLPGTPNGGIIHYTYDARGNITQRRYESSTPGTPPDMITSATYPSCNATNFRICNRPSTTTDVRGKTTTYVYDVAHGGATSVTGPPVTGGSPQVRNTYQTFQATYLDGNGQQVQGTPVWRPIISAQCTTSFGCGGPPNEVANSFSYDQNILINGSSIVGGGTSSSWIITNTPVGDVQTVDGPLSGSADRTRYFYDAARQLTGVIGPDPDGWGPLLFRARSISYNGEGQATSVAGGTTACQTDTCMNTFQPLQVYGMSYNAQGRLSAEGMSGTSGRLYSYTLDGLLRCIAVRMNPSGIEPDACLAASPGIYGPDRITQFTYNTYFERTRTTTALGTGAAATEVTTYDARGLPHTIADGRGNLTTLEYDNLQRLVKIRYPDAVNGSASSNTDFDLFIYEMLAGRSSNLIGTHQLRDGFAIDYSYDGLGRTTLRTFSSGDLTINYGYDLLSRLVSSSTSAQAIGFTYNHLSLPLTQSGPRGTTTSYYDSAGRRTAMTYPGGTYTVNYQHLITGEITEIYGSGALLNTYEYDDLGRRVTLLRGNGTPGRTTYSYDVASRLTQLQIRTGGSIAPVQQLDFSYNPAGQIVSTTRSNDQFAYTGYTNGNVTDVINGLNQVISTGGAAVTYDARGNIASALGSSFTYNSDNRMTTAPGTTMAYDPLLRLYEVVDGGTSRYAYDGQRVIAEYDGSDTLVRRFVHGPGVDELVATGTSTYLLADERGSIIGTSDSAGTITPSNSYDEFGRTAASGTIPFRYTGQMSLAPASVYHYRARAYHQQLGRFMQTDPIGYAAGMNLYAYVGNDPVNLVDPLGLHCTTGSQPGVSDVDVTFCNDDRDISRRQPFGLPLGFLGGFNFLQDPAFEIPNLRRMLEGFDRQPPTPRCGSGPRVTISPFGVGGTAFWLIGGFSVGAEAGISVPISALRGNFRGTQLYGSASFTQLLGVGAFVGGGTNYGVGYTPSPLETGVTSLDPGAPNSAAPVVQGGAAWAAGGEFAVQVNGSPQLSGGIGPRAGFGGYLAGGIKHSATLASPELCY